MDWKRRELKQASILSLHSRIQNTRTCAQVHKWARINIQLSTQEENRCVHKHSVKNTHLNNPFMHFAFDVVCLNIWGGSAGAAEDLSCLNNSVQINVQCYVMKWKSVTRDCLCQLLKVSDNSWNVSQHARQYLVYTIKIKVQTQNICDVRFLHSHSTHPFRYLCSTTWALTS